MKRVAGYVAGMAFLMAAVTANAGPWGRGPGMGPGMGGQGPGDWMGMGMLMATELGLTKEQVSEMQAMRERHFSENAPLREKLFSKRQELRLLWASPNPDAAQIMAKQKEIAELQAQLQEAFTRHRLEALNLLTPEQREKLSSLMQERGPGRGWGGHGRPWR
ncbi:MAG: Spy/CpxP family protein refolding chaperone [Thermodesulfobacteriota bacterium]